MKAILLIVVALTAASAFAEAPDFILLGEKAHPAQPCWRCGSNPQFEDSFIIKGDNVASVHLCDAPIDDVDGERLDKVGVMNTRSLIGECVEVFDRNGNILLRKEHLKSKTPIDLSDTNGQRPRAMDDVVAENRQSQKKENRMLNVDRKCEAKILKSVSNIARAATPQSIVIPLDPSHNYLNWGTLQSDKRFDKYFPDYGVTLKGADWDDRRETWLTVRFDHVTCAVKEVYRGDHGDDLTPIPQSWLASGSNAPSVTPPNNNSNGAQ